MTLKAHVLRGVRAWYVLGECCAGQTILWLVVMTWLIEI
jgi:hypothetical protein